MTGGGDDRVVVVGAGILGCSIAVHLVDRGVWPVVIDPDRPGQGTSTGSFASISGFGKDPVAWFQLACAGVSGWPRFAGRIGGEVGLRRAGEVRVADDPEAGRRLPGRWPTPAAAATRSGRSTPTSWPGCCRGARRPGDGGQLRPQRRPGRAAAGAGRLPEGAGRGRGEVPHRPGPGPPDDDDVRVQAGSQVLRPETCVLAAGAEAVQVAAAVGLQVPTVASPGLLAQTRPLAPLTDRVVYVPGGPGPAVHLRQRADGSVLVGERTQETLATSPGLAQARALVAQAARFLPPLAGVGVDTWWLAYRPMPSDRLPIVGRLPWLDPLYVAVSHSGVTLAPVLGRLIAAEVATQTSDGLLAPFRPARFAERTTRVLLEVESVFRDPAHQDRST